MILTRALGNKTAMNQTSLVRTAANVRNYFSRTITLRHLAVMACVAIIVAANPAAWAGSINYGNFNVPAAGIMFNNVTESSGTDAVPLFGPPDPFQIGMDFDPTSFVSSATGGASDITDGQLNFTIMGASNPNGYVGITGFNLTEAGDYTLVGSGTVASQVFVGAIARATVTEINGLPVSPITLPPVNVSAAFNLAANPGVVQPWSVGLGFLINLPQGQRATKVEVAINNSLGSLSEPASIAFIAKKDFRVTLLPPDVVGDPLVPEPTSLVLLSMAGVMGLAVQRSRG